MDKTKQLIEGIRDLLGNYTKETGLVINCIDVIAEKTVNRKYTVYNLKLAIE